MIAKRATLAQQQGQVREALLAWRFAAPNPASDLAPSRTDPDQHALTHRRERLLALGTRGGVPDQAENVAESLGKGHRAVVLGRLRTRVWETSEGEKRTSTEIDADEVAPALRWAVAQPERATRTRTPSGAASAASSTTPRQLVEWRVGALGLQP